MSGHSRLTVALAIALALPAFACAFAQDTKTTTVETKVQDVEKVTTVKEVKDVKEKAKPAKQKAEDVLKDAVKKIEKVVADKPAAKTSKEFMKQNAAVMKGAAPVAVAKDADGLDPMAQQFVAQFTPLVKTEVHLLLSVCEPTDDQRKKIVAGRTKAVKEAAKLYSQSQQRQGRFQNTATYPQPRGLVQESLLAAAKPLLSEEQIGRYQVEVDRRADDQKKLGIRNIIAKMDQDLALSAIQRDKLDIALAKNWNNAWCQSLEMFMYGDQFFPAIPDGVVVPILSPKQSVVWKGTQRNNNQFFGGFGFMNGMEMNDDFPADENVEEVKPDPAVNVNGAAPFIVAPAEPVKVAPVVAPKDTPKDKPKDKPKDGDTPKADAAKKDALKEKAKREQLDYEKSAPIPKTF